MTDLIKRDDALLPCPFCGGDKNTICKTDYDGRDAYAVSCRYPNCHGAIFMLGYGYFAIKEEAIAAWNTRALPAVDPAAIREAALEAKLAKAVEALRYYAVQPALWDFDDSLQARKVLAELEEK